MTPATTRTTVALPALHPRQADVARDPARFKVLVCGRRWGKTRLGVFLAVERALRGRRAWWVAPTYAQASVAWRLARPLAAQVPGTVVREAERVLRVGGGEIWFKSADQPDNLRGEAIDFLVMDEADFIPAGVWEQVLRPALADRKGAALFASTPNVENGWFHQLFARGQRGDEGWRSWSFPSETNPFLDPREIAAARAQLPAIVARREFDAEFVSAAGARIQRAWLRHGAPLAGLSVAMGVDLAISTKTGADWTAAVVIGRVTAGEHEGRCYVLDAARVRAPFHQVLAFVRQMATKWSPAAVAIESVQYQAAVIQELLRTTDLPVRGVKPDRDKLTRFQPLEARYEQGLIWHAPDLPPEFERELLGFPVGDHDDQVDALAYAWQAAFATEFVGTIDHDPYANT
jgi:predicted phage terminase large subunit-like protein